MPILTQPNSMSHCGQCPLVALVCEGMLCPACYTG